MQKTRYIGLDFGDKTIGVALGSIDGRVATGLTTIRRSQPEALRPSINSLREIITTYGITHIVLGHPINMDGSLSRRAEKTQNFRDKLKRNFKSIEVILWDERLSTQAVTKAFYANTGGGKKRKETYNSHVDEMAAVYILQGYLNRNYKTEETMENEPNMPEDFDNMGDIILMTDEDGEEYQLHVLATKEGENCIYLLTAVAEDDDDTSEVLHFKCAALETDTDLEDGSDEEEMPLELVDETHQDFELVMELFKADYEALGIIIDEEDPSLGVQEE
ncbi:MAG: Holliday junction resolvase RuvX [Defluviitaleaceae bacterium]|nr:Holliday junction resolvase RuvX [Defluviitaleaceae bacterium]